MAENSTPAALPAPAPVANEVAEGLVPGEAAPAPLAAPPPPVNDAEREPAYAPAPPAPADTGTGSGAAVDMVLPTMPEETHPAKPTWRRGYKQYGRMEYLLCTVTPSDCSTRRLRPPREWFDSFLGANLNFVVGGQGPDGAPVSFLLKAHAYEYVKHEYYLQGSDVKKMFRVMGFRPGDGLKFEVASRASGIPTTRLTVIPAERNPNAAAILAQAADLAAKRDAQKAAKLAGGTNKRKEAVVEPEVEGGVEGDGSGRRSRPRAVKRFGDDFVVGIDEAWQHAAASDDDYAPMSDNDSADTSLRRKRRGGASFLPMKSGHLPPSGEAWLPPGSSKGQGQQQQEAAEEAGAGVPEVVATGHAEGRNVLRIKINRAGTSDDAAVDAPTGEGEEGGEGGATNGNGTANEGGCPLAVLAAATDDVPQQEEPAAGVEAQEAGSVQG